MERDPSICTGGELAVMDRASLFDVEREALHKCVGDWLTKANGFRREFVTGHSRVFANLGEWGWQRAEIVELARASSSWGELLERFFTESVRRSGARRWLEKTPGNVFAFHRAHEYFPDAYFVHLIRDGRDAIASLMRRGHSPFLATSRWMCGVLAGLRLRGLGRYFEVRYEELVENPEDRIRALCGYVGQKYSRGLIEAVDPTAGAASETWQAAEAAAITSAPIGGHRSANVQQILAHMAAVRLTDAGHAMLPRPTGFEDLGDLSALELQGRLGYDGGELGPRRLASEEVAAANREVTAYQSDQRARQGAGEYPCPTLLKRN
jgi:hypothetical protein